MRRITLTTIAVALFTTMAALATSPGSFAQGKET